MTTGHGRLNDHEKFRELGALAASGALTALESSELNAHLENCEECREACHQYLILATEGIPMLAAAYSHGHERESWDDTATRRKLFARVNATEQRLSFKPNGHRLASIPTHLLHRIVLNPFGGAALTACLVAVVGFSAYRLGARTQAGAKQIPAYSEDHFHKLAREKKSVDELLGTQTMKLFQLQKESSAKELELAKLRSALRTLEDRSNELMAAKNQTEEQLRDVSQQRNTLSAQLRDAQEAYQNIQAELVSLRAERDKALLRTASLESRIDNLTASNREQARLLKDDEQYLAADRDIRELMGARKLYIADVFDVDSASRTRKPFGRVFYTQDKSLIFYAFDLDRQSGIKNASSFQVWGRKDTAQGEQAQPMNLGILYMDNETNRRWVMRVDDPKQLAEIDAVFVTVEPRGGSQKPTSKPFLYALLRKEVNHP
jgi:hypothetical protein